VNCLRIKRLYGRGEVRARGVEHRFFAAEGHDDRSVSRNTAVHHALHPNYLSNCRSLRWRNLKRMHGSKKKPTFWINYWMWGVELWLRPNRMKCLLLKAAVHRALHPNYLSNCHSLRWRNLKRMARKKNRPFGQIIGCGESNPSCGLIASSVFY
jgi:hypothetical protein